MNQRQSNTTNTTNTSISRQGSGPLAELELELRRSLPTLWTRMRGARGPRATSFIDARLGDHVVTVQWSPQHGFGVSTVNDATDGYGEGPDETFPDARSTFERVRELLREGAHTVPPKEVLLRELRALLGVTQGELAESLGVQQAAVSRFERREDVTLSSLRRYVRALGSELEISVRTPSGERMPLADGPVAEKTARKPKARAKAQTPAQTPPQTEKAKASPAPRATKARASCEHIVPIAHADSPTPRSESTPSAKRETADLHHWTRVLLAVARRRFAVPESVSVDWCDDATHVLRSRRASRIYVNRHELHRATAQATAQAAATPCTTSADRGDLYNHVAGATLRALLSHEIGHLVPAEQQSIPALSSFATSDELFADACAGWLGAQVFDEAMIGARVFQTLGCTSRSSEGRRRQGGFSPRCSHPSPHERACAYLAGHALGTSERTPHSMKSASDQTTEHKPQRESGGTQLQLLVLRSLDVERSRDFYAELGLHFHVEQHGTGPVHYSTKIGETVLELYPRKTEASAAVRLGLPISVTEATCERLQQKRLLQSQPRVLRSACQAHAVDATSRGGERRRLVLSDPDGNQVEVWS